MNTNKLAAKSHFPSISLASLRGGTLTLSDRKSQDSWKLIIIYRGLHCPICADYLQTLQGLKEQLGELNVEVVVASADPLEKAKKQFEDYAPFFSVGYELSIEQMEALGLYISSPRSPKETDRPFAEPGMFIMNEKEELHIIDISNAPFARPDLESVVRGIKFVRDPKNEYPVRGTYGR
jgi:peroxiredoxin